MHHCQQIGAVGNQRCCVIQGNAANHADRQAEAGASLVIATHDQRVVQALAAVPRLQRLDLNAGTTAAALGHDLNEIGTQRLLDKR